MKEQPGSASVVQGVTEDRFGIGYSGIGYRTSGVKAVALSLDGATFSTGSYADVVSGFLGEIFGAVQAIQVANAEDHVTRRLETLGERRADLAALVGYEVGKSRLECVGEIEEVEEERVEVIVERSRIKETVAAMRQAHPYEEPAFDVLSLAALVIWLSYTAGAGGPAPESEAGGGDTFVTFVNRTSSPVELPAERMRRSGFLRPLSPASVSSTITAAYGVSLMISHSPEPAPHGSTVTENYTFTNLYDTLNSATVTFNLPSGNRYGFRQVSFPHQPGELPRTGNVRPLADHRKCAVRPDGIRF